MVKLFDKIKELWNKFWKADIVKVFSFTSISTLVRMLTGFVSVKVVAVIIGPAGIALLGQLNNFSTIILNLASGGINSGVTKYVAENKSESVEIVKPFISTAFKITIFCSLFIGLCLISFHSVLSNLIMLSSDYGYVFVIFGITILFYALNNLLMSILNGYKEFKRFVKINIISSVCGLAFTVLLVSFWQLQGSLISAVTFQSVMLFVTLWMARKLPWMKKDFFLGKVEKPIAKKYLRYAAMSFVSIAVVPVSQLVLRGYVIANISDVQAGWWEAMNRLSGMYLMVITSSFSVYYLPRLSEIKTNAELRHEIFKTYKVIIPLLVAGFTLIYLFRGLVIRLLFTEAFYPMENLFIWQLIGDLFKISSWLLTFLMVAKSMTKTFIATEIAFSALFVGLSFLFMRTNGVVGIMQGYLVNYAVYLVVMLVVFRRIMFCRS
jgi:PST family polysaccharide transporter